MAQDFRNDLQSAVGTSEVTLVTGGNYDAVIGIRLCNILTSTIELIQGGAKIVLKSGDVLKAVSNTASSVDIVTSYIDQISS
jgi:hypothetical protein